MAVILDAQNRCITIERNIRKNLQSLSKLCLASVAIGNDYSAKVYRTSQEQLAKKLDIKYLSRSLSSDTSFENFKIEIDKLNDDPQVTGIILNKPFPSGWQDEEVFSRLNKDKDVEGMHPVNLGKLLLMLKPDIISPTVRSVLDLLDEALARKQESLDLRGKKVTIVGFSALIGQPLALILGRALATVSITHIGTLKEDLPGYIKSADIVISATGVPHLIKGDWIKQGAIVIDVGTGKKDGKLAGDVEFDKAKEKAAVITSVSGGVGKLTTMCLFDNLVRLAKK